MALTLTPKATTTVTTTVDIKPTTRRKLLSELRAFAELKAQRDAIDHAMNSHKAAIDELRASTGENSLAIEGFKVALVSPTRTVLNEKKLIELGCAVAWLVEAKETKPSKPYLKVSVPGGREEE